jgi:hypothetical protein
MHWDRGCCIDVTCRRQCYERRRGVGIEDERYGPTASEKRSAASGLCRQYKVRLPRCLLLIAGTPTLCG